MKKDFQSNVVIKQLNISNFKDGIHLSFWGAEVALLGGFLGCARNPTGQDHVAARLPYMIHGFLAVKLIRCNGGWPRLKLRRLFHNKLHIFDFNDFYLGLVLRSHECESFSVFQMRFSLFEI